VGASPRPSHPCSERATPPIRLGHSAQPPRRRATRHPARVLTTTECGARISSGNSRRQRYSGDSRVKTIVLCVGVIALPVGNAHAAFVSYLDRTSFQADFPGLSTVDFEDFGVNNSAPTYDITGVAFPGGPFGPASVSRLGASFSSVGVVGGYLSSGGPVVTSTQSAVNVFGASYGNYVNAGSAYLVGEISRSTLKVDFTTGQTVIALDVGTLLPPLLPDQDPAHDFGSNRTFDLVLDFASSGTYVDTFDLWKFVGFKFNEPISSFTIGFADGPESSLFPDSANYIGLDNLMLTAQEADGSAVPEPASLCVWGGMSLVGFAFGWRKRQSPGWLGISVTREAPSGPRFT
jgi:hypothetical protein